MKAAKATASAPAGAEAQLRVFIGKFGPKDRQLIPRCERRYASGSRRPTSWFGTSYNFFVIGYSPTERPSDAVVSIAARANGLGLCFIRGAGLPDPKKLLLGSGNQTRFIRLESAGVLARPEVEALHHCRNCSSEGAFPSHRAR